MSTHQATILSEAPADDLCIVNGRIVAQTRVGDGYIIELEGDEDALMLIAAETGTSQPVFCDSLSFLSVD